MTAAEKAAAFRERHGLGIAPIRELVALVGAEHRIDVWIVDMPVGVDAMTRRDPETGAHIIAVATSDNPERQRFSLAHELGHIAFGDFEDDVRDLHATGSAETRAHDFARHLLVPLDGVRKLAETMPGADAEHLTSAVVQHFGVSSQPAAFQLHAAALITAGEKTAVGQLRSATLATKYGWSAERETQMLESNRPQPPQRIVTAATRAYADGKLGLRVLARIRGTEDVAALEQELAVAGLVPAQDPVVRPVVDIDHW